MSKSPAAKQNYAMRREARIARLKTAAAMMPHFLRVYSCGADRDPDVSFRVAAAMAVCAADALLAELAADGPEKE